MDGDVIVNKSRPPTVSPRPKPRPEDLMPRTHPSVPKPERPNITHSGF